MLLIKKIPALSKLSSFCILLVWIQASEEPPWRLCNFAWLCFHLPDSKHQALTATVHWNPVFRATVLSNETPSNDCWDTVLFMEKTGVGQHLHLQGCHPFIYLGQAPVWKQKQKPQMWLRRHVVWFPCNTHPFSAQTVIVSINLEVNYSWGRKEPDMSDWTELITFCRRGSHHFPMAGPFWTLLFQHFKTA